MEVEYIMGNMEGLQLSIYKTKSLRKDVTLQYAPLKVGKGNWKMMHQHFIFSSAGGFSS